MPAFFKGFKVMKHKERLRKFRDQIRLRSGMTKCPMGSQMGSGMRKGEESKNW